MTALTRFSKNWDPFKEMDDLHNQLDNLILGRWGRLPRKGGNSEEENVGLSEWAPMVDISEDDKEYVIKAELPEVNKDDLKVRVEKGVLTISGERKFEKEEKGKRYHRIERAYGTFTRSFTLPEDADGGKVNAEFKNGVLTVHLAKSEQAQPKAIDVKVS